MNISEIFCMYMLTEVKLKIYWQFQQMCTYLIHWIGKVFACSLFLIISTAIGVIQQCPNSGVFELSTFVPNNLFLEFDTPKNFGYFLSIEFYMAKFGKNFTLFLIIRHLRLTTTVIHFDTASTKSFPPCESIYVTIDMMPS